MSAAGIACLTTVMVVLAAVAFGPDAHRVLARAWQRHRARREERARALQRLEDPGRMLRAERRAEQELIDALGPEGFEAYRALGFAHVFAADGKRGYLIYPRTSIVSFDPVAGEPLDEYTVSLARARTDQSSDAADVLAKRAALLADEGSVASPSNMHLLGRDVDPARVRRDLIRLSEWTSRRPGDDPESTAGPLRQPPHRDRGQTSK